MKEMGFPVLSDRLRAFGRFAGWLTIFAGILVLVGWITGTEALKRVFPGMVAMHPLSAICFIFVGTSLVLQIRGGSARVQMFARVLAFVVMVVGITKLLSFQGGWSFPLDKLYPMEPGPTVPTFRGRMSQNTSLCFMMMGAALYFLDRRGWKGFAFQEVLVYITAVVALLALVGQFYETRWLQGLSMSVPMAIHTAITFMLLAMGTACARPQRGMMGIFTADSAGGIMARRILPSVILVFILLGALRIFGEAKGFYGDELGIALFVVASIAVLGVVVFWCARSLHQMDLKRQAVEMELDRFFRLSPDMLGVVGIDGRFKRINPAFGRVLGYTEEELLKSHVLDLIHPDDYEGTMAELKVLMTGESTFQYQNRYRCSDGTWKWLEWNTRPILEENCLYAVARDVTEKKNSELAILSLNTELRHQADRLASVNEELESFSYSVSHDLRAPLRGISGFAQALEDHSGELLDATSKGYLARVRGAAERMGSLIDNLLKLSRLSRMEMQMVPVNLSELAEHAVAGLAAAEPAREVAVEIEPQIHAMGDPVLLGVLVENLVSNAWKFTSRTEGARIEVRSAPAKEGWVGITFADNGVGFDERYSNKLFGAFQRLHSQVEFPGLGIGLATVMRVVRRHGGEVRAKSRINHGASFTVELETPTERSQIEKQDHSAG